MAHNPVKQLKRLMINKDINQSELAEIIGVSQSMVSRYIKNKDDISEEQLELLIIHYELPKDYFSSEIESDINDQLSPNMEATINKLVTLLERQLREKDRQIQVQNEIILSLSGKTSEKKMPHQKLGN